MTLAFMVTIGHYAPMRGAGNVVAIGVALICVASLAGCGNDSESVASASDVPGTTVSSTTTTSSAEPSPAPTSVEKPSGCPSDPPFHATVLPTGFDEALKAGRSHQIPWDTTVRYYSGAPGAFIDIYPSELLAWRPASVLPLSVLNTTGQFGEVEDGYSASFLLPCGAYTLLSSGVTADDFKAVIAGLTGN